MRAAASTHGWSGDGSKEDPWVIEDMLINGTGYGYCISIKEMMYDYVIIRNNTVFGNNVTSGLAEETASIGIKNCLHVVIEDNIVRDTICEGILMYYSDGRIENNRVTNTSWGMIVSAVDNEVVVKGNTFLKNGAGIDARGQIEVCDNVVEGLGNDTGWGISAGWSSPHDVWNNRVSSVALGMSFASETSKCFNNTIDDCGEVGIECNFPTPHLENNTVSGSRVGIWIERNGAVLRNNTLVDSPVYLEAAREEVLKSHSIDGSNTLNGKPIQYLMDSTDVDIQPSVYAQSILVSCSNVTFLNKTLSEGYWFQTQYCDNITIEGNHVDMPLHSMWIIHADDVTIDGNTFDDLEMQLLGYRFDLDNNTFNEGQMIAYGSDFHINNNTISSGRGSPVELWNMGYAALEDNNFTVTSPAINEYAVLTTGNREEGLYMRRNALWGAGCSIPWEIHLSYTGYFDVDTSNTVNGRPFLFLDGVTDRRVGEGYGQVIINNSKGILVQDLVMGPGDGGVAVLGSSDILVRDCDFDTLMNGAITVHYSDNVSVSGCLFQGGSSRIHFHRVSYDLTGPLGEISGNYMMDIKTYYTQPAAIYLESSKLDAITGNYIADVKGYGIYSKSSGEYTEMSHNEVANCISGAFSGAVDVAEIHHNAFVGNGHHYSGSQCSFSGYKLAWDNGSEGNYWSNYEERYPYATNDGTFWNTGYSAWGHIDNYPFVDYHDFVPPMARMYCNDTAYPGTREGFSSWSLDNQGVVAVEWWFHVHEHLSVLNGSAVDFTFNASGDHAVILKVRDAAGNEREVRRVVHVFDTIAPLADAGPDLEVAPGETLVLNGTASWDDDRITRYEWSFVYNGSTVVLEGALVNFTFDVEGTYEVTLNVSDAAGHWDLDTMTVTVGDTEPPVAVIDGEDVTVDQGTELTLSGRGSADNWRIETWEWTITSPSGGEATYEGPDISHVFAEAGAHKVTLRVTDPKGLWDETAINVTALDVTPPAAVAGGNVEVAQDEPVELDGSASTDNVGVVNWTWNISGPGGDAVLHGPTHEVSFPDVGHYTISLTVYDARGNSAKASFVVTVLDTTPPEAVAGEDVTAIWGERVDLDGSASWDNVEVVLHVWTFEYDGREVTRSGAITYFTFDVPGVYTVTLTVTDLAGNTATDDLVVTVTDMTRPVAVAGPDVTVDQHTQVTFDGSLSTDNVGVVDFLWVFEYGGEKRECVGMTPEFNFDLAGVYAVTLTVSDTAGNSAWDALTVTVLDTDPPVAVAGADVKVQEGDTVHLDGSASTDNVGVVSWRWTLWYNSTQEVLEGEEASFAFHAAGNYTVTLTVEDARGNTARDTLVVNVEGPGGGEPEPEDEGGISMAVVGIALAVVVAVVLVAVVLWQRQQH